MKNLPTTWVVFFFAFMPVLAGAQSAQEWIERGNVAYENRDYDSSIVCLQQALLLDSNSALIHYNQGNNYYRQGQLAPALWHYHKANKLAPDDKDIAHNLSIAQQQRVDEIEPLPQPVLKKMTAAILGWFDYKTWTLITLSLSVLAAVLASLYFFSNNGFLKKFGFFGSLTCISLSLVAWLFCSKKHDQVHELRHAIVFEKVLNVVNEPKESASVLFVLHEGTEVIVRERRHQWVKISIQNGNEGWVLENTMKTY